MEEQETQHEIMQTHEYDTLKSTYEISYKEKKFIVKIRK